EGDSARMARLILAMAVAEPLRERVIGVVAEDTPVDVHLRPALIDLHRPLGIAVETAKSGHPGMPMGMADIAEVREAVDFLRYYAKQAREQFSHAEKLPSPTGESNELQ
ncbi:hypothetical protein ABGA94_18620, partial [Stenotrophomonas sp. 3diitr2024]